MWLRLKSRLRRWRNSLMLRLIGVGIALVLVGLAFRTQVLMPHLQKDVAELVAAQQLSIANYAAREIDAKLVARRELLRRLAADLSPAILASQPALADWLRTRQGLYPLFNSGLGVVRADGKVLLADYPVLPGRRSLSYQSSPWFLAALESKDVVISRPMKGRITGAPLIVIAQAVRDRRGKPLAVLAGVSQLDAPGFLDLLSQVRLGSGGGFLLISPADKLFVAASDPAMVFQPTPAIGVNVLHDRAMAGYRGTGVTVNARGVEELSAMVSVPSTGWFVVAKIPTAEAFRPIQQQRRLIMGNSLLTGVVVIAVLLLVLPWMFRPLTDAAREVRRMARGEVPTQPLPVQRQDEVGALVEGFNSLLKKLTDQEAALRQSQARLAQLALHDSLTGLPNRTMLEDRLEQALSRAERGQQQVALLFCDLDGFKPVNDHYGHDMGDQVLRQVAERLLEKRRKSDTVARIGGDEFVILLADLADARMVAAAVAEECVAAIAQPFIVHGEALNLGISIGIALYPQAGSNGSHLLSCADSAMYAAKEAGRGGYVFHG